MRVISRPGAWLSAALVLSVLMSLGERDGSALWFVDPLLLSIALVGFAGPWRRATLPTWRAIAAVVAIDVAVSLSYELSIAGGGPGTFGGMHPDTATSFLIAPGYYLPAALLVVWVVRRYALDRRQAFFVAAAMSWWEVAQGLPGTLVVLPYFATVYAMFGVAGFLVIDERCVWSDRPVSASIPKVVALGAACGAIAWLTFVFWSAAVT